MVQNYGLLFNLSGKMYEWFFIDQTLPLRLKKQLFVVSH
jgi:hypothetical protein